MPERTFFPNLTKAIAFAAAQLVLSPFVRNQESIDPSSVANLPFEPFDAEPAASQECTIVTPHQVRHHLAPPIFTKSDTESDTKSDSKSDTNQTSSQTPT